MLKLFSKSWYQKGRVGEYAKEKKLSKKDLISLVEGFKRTQFYELLKFALEDYRDKNEKELHELNVCAPGWDRAVATIITRRSTINWFEGMLTDLKGIDESQKESEKVSGKDFKEMYV